MGAWLDRTPLREIRCFAKVAFKKSHFRKTQYFAKLDTAFKETNNSHKSQALTAKRINANATIAIPQITAQ